jgi:hypothetical protein
MKKILVITLALMFALSGLSFASVQLYQDAAEKGHVNQLNCSTGLTCTKVGDRVNIVTNDTGAVAGITSGTIAGAAINSSTIGGTTPAAGAFTTLSSTGATTIGDAIGDIVTVTGKVAGASPFSFDGATADTVYTILAVGDATSSSKTVTLPSRTGTVSLQTGTVAITAGATPALTVGVGTQLYTDTITTDNQDQTITFSAGGTVGDRITIIFITDTGGSGDEVITFETTLVNSAGTLTLANLTAGRYAVTFVSDGTVWNEVSRTAALS